MVHSQECLQEGQKSQDDGYNYANEGLLLNYVPHNEALCGCGYNLDFFEFPCGHPIHGLEFLERRQGKNLKIKKIKRQVLATFNLTVINDLISIYVYFLIVILKGRRKRV